MQIIKVDPKNPKEKEVREIVRRFNFGKVVVLPTETVYTFAVDATNEDAVRLVYKIKGRDFKKPLHVVVSSLEMAKKYVKVNDKAKLLADKFLPGPLTLVLPKKNGYLPLVLTANSPTLGIRIPDMILNKKISDKFRKPYTTTSANISGGPNPYTVYDVLNQLSEQKKSMIKLVIDAGPLPRLSPSTIIDLTVSPARMLREGPIRKGDIEKIVPMV